MTEPFGSVNNGGVKMGNQRKKDRGSMLAYLRGDIEYKEKNRAIFKTGLDRLRKNIHLSEVIQEAKNSNNSQITTEKKD